MRYFQPGFAVALSAAWLASACGDAASQPDPHLTVVGSADLSVEAGQRAELAVRYHDRDERPLAGEIELVIVGDAGGSSLSTELATTDDDGVARVALVGGAERAAFAVEARVVGAAPARWNAAVRKPELAGTYRIESRFQVLESTPGLAATFDELCAIATSPGAWLVDRLALDDIGLGFAADIVDAAVDDVAPGFRDTLEVVKELLGQALAEFGVITELVAVADPATGGLSATHTVVAVAFNVGPLALDLAIGDQPVHAVDVGLDRGALTIDAHRISVPIGDAIGSLIGDVVVPLADPNAADLGEVIAGALDCEQLGAALAERIPVPLVDWRSLCVEAAVLVADSVLSGLSAVDDRTPYEVVLSGRAVGHERTGDEQVDALTDGVWTGTVEVAGAVGPLSEQARFWGHLHN